MPGQLRPDAKCPMCGLELAALSDTSSSESVIREYFHSSEAEPICVQTFTDHNLAAVERKRLETIPAGTPKN